MSAARSNRSSTPPKRNRRLGFERLEDRRVMTTYAELVADLDAGIPSSIRLDESVNVNGTLYFLTRSNENGAHATVWKADGTELGTNSLITLDPRTAILTNYNGTLVFSGGFSQDVYTSDGTPGGTNAITNLHPGARTDAGDYTTFNGQLYFTGSTTNRRNLYRTDGTVNGQELLSKFSDGPSDLVVFDGTIYLENNSQLSKYDDVNGITVISNEEVSSSLYNTGNALYYVAKDAATGFELWTSDGTTAGTRLVKDINLGSAHSHPYILGNVGGTVYFQADDGVHGYELWKTDGTEAGTSMVIDLNSGISSSRPATATVFGSDLFFFADDGIHGRELWKTNGTKIGTSLVKDIVPGSDGSGGIPYLVGNSIATVGGKVFFVAGDEANGVHLWRSDGTTEGTMLINSVTKGINFHSPKHLVNVNGTLYFSADSKVGDDLWKTVEINDPPKRVGFANSITTIAENTSIASAFKLADIQVVDDELGTDNLALTGPDATHFAIVGNELRLKAGTKLDYETKSSYHVTVTVDDPTIGNTPDASANFTLTVTNVVEPTLMISLNAAGNVEVRDMAGKDDNLTLWRNGPNVVIRDNSTAFDRGFTITNVAGASGNGTTQVSIPFATIQATGKPLLIATGNGNDSIQLDFLAVYATAPIPATGLVLSLGNGDDTLAFVNDATNNVWNLAGPQSGSVIVGQVGTVKFNGVEHIGGGQGADAFKLTNAAAANGILSIDSGRASMLNSLEVVRDASYTISDTQLIITPNVVGPPPQTFNLANFEQARLTIKHGDTLEKYLWTASTRTLKRLP